VRHAGSSAPSPARLPACGLRPGADPRCH
jgi:hypothetical protein